MAKRKPKPPELRIVCDTNILFTGSASDLIRNEVKTFIKVNEAHSDLRLIWYLPNTVIHERCFQMRQKSRELLPNVQKLEKLLGHNLNITEEIVDTRIDVIIEKQLSDLSIERLNVDINEVAWQDIIHNSLYRLPPFEKGEKEKGFRDSLICESFIQLINSSPSTPKVCRVILVTSDQLLQEAVAVRIQGKANVYIMESLEELKGLVNTLVSKMDEEFIGQIQELASEFFFKEEDKSGLYYKEEIRKRIREDYFSELQQTAENSDVRENGTWYMLKPRFQKKQNQRVTWATRIEVSAQAYKVSTTGSIFFNTGAQPSIGSMGTDIYNVPSI